MTRPVRPEKSMATREFSDTLRCSEGGAVVEEGRGEARKGEGRVDKGSEVKQARHSHWGMTNPVCTQNHFSTQEQRCVGKASEAQTKGKCASLFYNNVKFCGIWQITDSFTSLFHFFSLSRLCRKHAAGFSASSRINLIHYDEHKLGWQLVRIMCAKSSVTWCKGMQQKLNICTVTFRFFCSCHVWRG